MKKILTSLLAAVMLVCLCACAADTTDTDAPDTQQSSSDTVKEQNPGLYNNMNAILNSFN